MSARRLIAGLATTAVAVSALALTAGPASAAVDPDDTMFAPVANDLIGVGSDTSQNALFRLANGYNATSPAARLVTYAATGGGTIDLPVTDINRPNGSGAGKALLYGSSNNAEIDFARSSSAQSTAETDAGLRSFPFALDSLGTVVSGSVASNAPASLTIAQILEIYKGNTTNWNQIGGGNGVIKAYIPQAGSGTRTFFTAQLTAANGGAAVTLGSNVTENQENDDTTIKNDPNAIAPFSIGRAGLLGSTLRVETGFKADRALYNVVRGTSLGDAAVQSVFGTSGYVCSIAARPLIAAAGFQQLAVPARGGVCGSPTTTATSNFTLNQQVSTATTVAVTSPAAGTARIAATITGGTAPSGTVAFYEGATLLQSGVPLTSGQAVRTQPTTPGAHTYRAVFTPAAGSVFEPSEGTGSGNVLSKVASSIKESFPSKVKAGKKAKGTVTVTLTGTSAKATGSVVVKKGSKTLATKTLSNGTVKITLSKLKPGTNKLTVTWSGDANGNGSSKTFTIKVDKKKKKNKNNN